jgi:hypothetical protein
MPARIVGDGTQSTTQLQVDSASPTAKTIEDTFVVTANSVALTPLAAASHATTSHTALVRTARRVGAAVSTEAELRAALTDGATVDLTADIYLTAVLAIARHTGIILNGHGFKVDGQRAVQCFALTASSEVTINGLTITNCAADSGAGLSVSYSTAFLNGCALTGNVASYAGGAVYAIGSNIDLSGCTLTGNSAGDRKSVV